MHQLSSRNLQVLGTIIEEYIATAAPVGSKAVAGRSSLNLSSASIRNCMAELTELGLLEQPHTSAGRVPTSRAFRIYIDSLLRLRPLSSADSSVIMQSLDNADLDINEIFKRATGLVAEHCRQVSMVLAPERKSARWSGIGFTRSGRGKVLAVLALEGGMVETRLISTDIDFRAEELMRFGSYLNAHFKGMTLWTARQSIVDELARAGRDLEKIFRQALTLGAQTVHSLHDERELFVEGTSTIFDQVEFSSLDSARGMFAFLEERSRLLELLDAALTNSNVQVSFCEEGSGLPGCCVVSAPYGALGGMRGGAQGEVGGTAAGVVSIIGPNRMDYSQVMPVITCISGALTRILQARA